MAHYDETKPLLISCDASPYGVGAVLSQQDSQGREAPIAFASRTLGAAERNYVQLDREGLAVVFAANQFHKYSSGRPVTFVTDHHPLLGILEPQKPVPQIFSPRLTRWCLKLAAYDYDLKYRAGKLHQNADALSRVPLPDRIEEPHAPGDILMFAALPSSPLTAALVARLTLEDAILSELYREIQEGTVQRLRGTTSPLIAEEPQSWQFIADASPGAQESSCQKQPASKQWDWSTQAIEESWP